MGVKIYRFKKITGLVLQKIVTNLKIDKGDYFEKDNTKPKHRNFIITFN